MCRIPTLRDVYAAHLDIVPRRMSSTNASDATCPALAPTHSQTLIVLVSWPARKTEPVDALQTRVSRQEHMHNLLSAKTHRRTDRVVFDHAHERCLARARQRLGVARHGHRDQLHG